MSDGGKGSKPRPFSVSQETYDSNWDKIFGKKKKTESEKFDEQVVMKDEFYDVEEAWDEIENSVGIYDGSLRSNTNNWK